MVCGYHRVNCEELNKRRGEVEEGWSVLYKSREEHLGLEHGQRDQLPSVPQHVGHGDIHGEDVEHGEDADSDLADVHALHHRVVTLDHVRHQVTVSQLDTLGHSSGP